MNGICCQIKSKSTVTSVVLLCQIRFLYADIGLKLLNLLELTFVFRNVLVFCHFFLEKKVTKNSRLCRNPAILTGRYGGSEKKKFAEGAI
jgi:hypothetical protein